jgi:hypothetical protein
MEPGEARGAARGDEAFERGSGRCDVSPRDLGIRRPPELSVQIGRERAKDLGQCVE